MLTKEVHQERQRKNIGSPPNQNKDLKYKKNGSVYHFEIIDSNRIMLAQRQPLDKLFAEK